MGFLKDLGVFAGELVGGVIGGAVGVVGEVTNSEFIKDVGKGVHKVTAKTGELVGNVASGTVDTVEGLVTGNSKQAEGGFDEVCNAVGNTISGIGNGIVNIVEKGGSTVSAIIDGDTDKAIEAGKDIAKIAAISVMAIGVVDIVDGVDGVEALDNPIDNHDGLVQQVSSNSVDSEYQSIENPEMHHVEPYWRTLPDGREIYVDGDGDTSVNTGNGWHQHNPDFRVKG